MDELEATQLFDQLLAAEKLNENKLVDLRVTAERACRDISQRSQDPKALRATDPDRDFAWQVNFRDRAMVKFIPKFGRLLEKDDPGGGLVRCQLIPTDTNLPALTLDLVRDSSWFWRINRQPGTGSQKEVADAIFQVIAGRLEREFQRYRT